MILAEKIIALRRQKNWSQEELAEQLEISRQSVSKWESGASIPELDKIIGMSNIFGVSTDYLLKDEYDTDVILETKQGSDCPDGADRADILSSDENAARGKVRSVSLEEANACLQTIRKTARPIAVGVLLCILSPVCLLVLGGWSEFGPVSVTENQAGGLGIVILLLMVAAAVVLFIINGMKLEKYEYLEKEEIYLQYGVSGIVEKQKEAYVQSFRWSIAAGVTLCILGVLPLFIGAMAEASEICLVYCTCIMLAIISAGVFLLVHTSMIWGGYQKLLQEGDYSVEEKRFHKGAELLGSAYWCLATAVYLGVSLSYNNWETSWIIWPVAALVFVALLGIFKIVKHSRREQ